jgi:hypothetical protein
LGWAGLGWAGLFQLTPQPLQQGQITGLERLQVICALTNTDSMDRQAECLGKRNNNAALGRPVKFGHDQPADIGHFAERTDLRDRILANSAIEHDDRIMRRGIIQFADNADNL